MVSALQLVFAGGIYIPPEILMREETPPAPPSATATRLGVQLQAEPAELGLTGRQSRRALADDAGQEQQGNLPRA